MGWETRSWEGQEGVGAAFGGAALQRRGWEGWGARTARVGPSTQGSRDVQLQSSGLGRRPVPTSPRSGAKGPPCPAGEKKSPKSVRKAAAGEQRPSVCGPLIRPSQKAQRQVTMQGTCPSLMDLSLFCLFIYHLHCACLAGSPPRARPTPASNAESAPQPRVPTQRPPGHPAPRDNIGAGRAPAAAPGLHRSVRREGGFPRQRGKANAGLDG